MNMNPPLKLIKEMGRKPRRAGAAAALALLLPACAAAAAVAAVAVKATLPPRKPAANKTVLPAKYAPILKRNMFGFLPRKEGTTAPEPGAAPAVTFDTPAHNPLSAASTGSGVDIPVNAIPEPAYSLTGIIEVNGQYKAIVEDRTSGRGYYISEGSAIGEYTATKITAGGVSLEKADKKIDLGLDSSKTDAAQAGEAPPKSELVPNNKTDRRWLPPSVSPRLGGK